MFLCLSPAWWTVPELYRDLQNPSHSCALLDASVYSCVCGDLEYTGLSLLMTIMCQYQKFSQGLSNH